MTAYSAGLVILRVVLGLTMAAHGYKKFFGPGGLTGTAGWFDSIGMRPGMLNARMAASVELGAGIFLALGFLTPFAAAAFVSLMFVAAWTVHRRNGFFITGEGWEYNFVLAGSAVALGALGGGRFSLDRLLFADTDVYHYLRGWWGLGIALIRGVAGGVGQVALFFRPPVAAVTPN